MIFREINTILSSNLTKSERRGILLSSIGSMHEYYDFVVFGLVAVYFAHNILHGTFVHSGAGCIILGIFIFGYLFRPLGMYCYTKLYYRFERIYLLNRLTSSIIILASIVVATIPDKNNYYALLLLILARSLQGFARGTEAQAEYGYLNVLLGERRGVAIFGLIAGAEIGILLAIVVNNVLNHFFSLAQMSEYGWRLPFVFGALLSTLVYMLRYFFRLRQFESVPKMVQMVPSWLICAMYPRQIFFTSLLGGFRSSFGWLLILLIPLIFYTQFHYDHIYVGHLLLIASLGSVISSFLVLRYVSIYNARLFLPYSIVVTIPALLFFANSVSHEHMIGLSLLVIGCISGALAVLNMQVSFSMYSAATRLSSLSMSYNLGHTMISGLVLLIILSASELLNRFWLVKYPFSWWLLYITVTCLIILGIFLLIMSIKTKKYQIYTELLYLMQYKK